MGERHAYGTSLCCISRRVYILVFCAAMSIVCFIRLGRWFLQMGILKDIIGEENLPHNNCNGLECYEVFTCRGFGWTTKHLREPLATVLGAVVFPLGVYGAVHGYRDMLKITSFFITLLAGVYVVCFIMDLIYYDTCDAYPGNVVEEVFLWPIAFPIRAGAQADIRKMNFFPVPYVNKLTDGFHAMIFYCVWMAIQCIILCYTAWEARMLGMLAERGPLGLGVHYGLGQFDEIINHHAIKKRKEKPSKFVQDGQIATTYDDPEMPLGYFVGHTYGAFVGQPMMRQPEPSKNLAHWEEKMKSVEEEVDEARENLADKRRELASAQDEMRNEKGREMELEQKAEAEMRESVLGDELYQERKAEELAEDAAEEARQEAERQGRSAQESMTSAAIAYQRSLAKSHRDMLQLAKSRTLHEHYRYTERVEEFKHMEEEVTQKVHESMVDVGKAESKLQEVEAAKAALEQEKLALIQSGQWVESQGEANGGEPEAPSAPESSDPPTPPTSGQMPPAYPSMTTSVPFPPPTAHPSMTTSVPFPPPTAQPDWQGSHPTMFLPSSCNSAGPPSTPGPPAMPSFPAMPESGAFLPSPYNSAGPPSFPGPPSMPSSPIMPGSGASPSSVGGYSGTFPTTIPSIPAVPATTLWRGSPPTMVMSGTFGGSPVGTADFGALSPPPS